MVEDEELTAADIDQQYYKNIVKYKDRLVYVHGNRGDSITLSDVGSSKTESVVFKRSLFKACPNRVGMINIAKSVVYCVRNPVRKMQIGHNLGNLVFQKIPADYPMGARDTIDILIEGINKKEFGKALNSDYPSFEEALAMVGKEHSAVAFDKQFAVTKQHRIIYKKLIVGVVKEGQIVFNTDFKHLETLLGGLYEKYI